MGFVVDASVCTKWFFDEEHQEEAVRLLEGAHVLSAPDLLIAEFGNVVWKKLVNGEITSADGAEMLENLVETKVSLVPSTELAVDALRTAAALKHPFYDCLYLALARRERFRLVTADERLRRKAAGTPHAALVLWVGDVP